jgi:hypothetical protein
MLTVLTQKLLLILGKLRVLTLAGLRRLDSRRTKQGAFRLSGSSTSRFNSAAMSRAQCSSFIIAEESRRPIGRPLLFVGISFGP